MGVFFWFTFLSFIGIAIACFYDKLPGMFWLAVASSIFQGVSCSFGEAVFLGFLKGFPSAMISDVSVGTGFAGILATLTLMLARGVGLSN